MVIGRREAEKARARWAKLKRFVKSGAYLDDWSAPYSLVTVASTIKRMNSREKSITTNGESVHINTSRSKPSAVRRNSVDPTSNKDMSEDQIFATLHNELIKRDIKISVSRPMLMSRGIKQRPEQTSNVSQNGDYSEDDYDEGEDVKLVDIKTYVKERRKLVKTSDVYYAACSLCKVSPVSNFLKQCSSYKVDLKNSFLSAQDVKALAISLVRDNRITALDISGNEIGALGVMFIAEMMVENNWITDLNLSGTIPGREGLEILSELLENNKNLKILRLEDNKIEHTEMQHIISIIENVPSLEELYLGHNALGFEGGKMLAKFLASNTTLKILDLQWNQIRKDTAKSICKAIGDNQSLWGLNLSWNGLGKEGCIEMATALKKNSHLVDLNLSSNRIDMTSLRFLLHGLVQNCGLKYIQIGRNPITTEGAKAVLKAIHTSKVSRLEVIQLEDISIDDQFLEFMKELKEAKSIRVTHGERIAGGNAVTEKDHDPHDLNMFDPVLVLVEYMRIDNLRLIDFFQYLDTGGRERLSKSNFRDGVANLGIPFTEHHLDIIMKSIDLKKDGVVDLEEFMTVHRDTSRQITQRTTRAKSKKKEDEGLIALRKILKEIVEKRNKTNKEKAKRKYSLAAAARTMAAARRFSVAVSTQNSEKDYSNTSSRPASSVSHRFKSRPPSSVTNSPRDRPPSSISTSSKHRLKTSIPKYSESPRLQTSPVASRRVPSIDNSAILKNPNYSMASLSVAQ